MTQGSNEPGLAARWSTAVPPRHAARPGTEHTTTDTTSFDSVFIGPRRATLTSPVAMRTGALWLITGVRVNWMLCGADI